PRRMRPPRSSRDWSPDVCSSDHNPPSPRPASPRRCQTRTSPNYSSPCPPRAAMREGYWLVRPRAAPERGKKINQKKSTTCEVSTDRKSDGEERVAREGGAT